MLFRYLGPLAASEGERGIPLGGPKQRLVLAHLLIRANEVVVADRLIDAIWPENPSTGARSSLHSYVSHLRKALGAGRIESHGQGYVLRAEPDDVDGLRFEALAREGHRLLADDADAASHAAREALALWRGPPFADLAGETSLQAEVDRLEELRVSVTEDRIEADLALGRHAQLVGELDALTSAHPLRERLWGHLMLALYRSGRQGEALEAFERARRMLADELGIDPSPDLRRLHEQVLRQDPALQPTLGRLRGYQLLEQIGAGQFGVVHRALQPHVEREVAVKAIHSHLANQPEFIRNFETEAQVVARIEHPHVVPLYDYWREPDGAYLVMRYLRGGNLRDLVDTAEQVAPEVALRLIDQVAQALAAAHRQNVVHRDVKPPNILLDEEGNAYLSDFGIARETNRTSPVTRQVRSYLSPERIRGEPPTPATDVYSLGVVLSELLPDPPAAVREIIDRSTAADPQDRYPDATAFLAAVRRTWSPSAVPAPVAPALRNPYKGLRAFTEADAPDFFGREALTAQLVTRLREDGPGCRFLAVVGASGSGKSSVVRAGLIPALRAGALPGSASWFVVQTAPGTAPLEELETALRHVAVTPPASLVEQIEASDSGLLRVTDLILPQGVDELLLVIDQFEEIFTLATDDDRARRFLDALVTAVTDPRSRLRVVITLRADFYDRPLRHRGLAALMRLRTETVVSLTAEELERAVTAPAERVGVEIEPGLVAQMIADVADQPAALPLLQYALTELFDRRRDSTLVASAYHEIGGVSGAVARRAEELHAALPDAAREAARQLFLRLVTLGEGVEDVRRRVLGTELLSLQEDPADMEAAIDAFGGARLLSFDRDPETRQPTVEVAHEALLRAWDRLRAWIDTARDDLRIERRLAGATRDWLDADREASYLVSGSRLDQYEMWREQSGLLTTPEQREFLAASAAERDRRLAEDEARSQRERALERRSFRQLRALVAVLATAALVATGLTVFAYTQRQRAEREARIASARELSAAAVANLDVDPERSILLALEAVDRTRAVDGAVLPEAEEALHRAVTTSRVELTVPDLGGRLEWSPDGDIFVTEGPENTGLVDIRDVETGESLRAWHGHDVDVNDIAFSADGTMLATTGDDGALRVWDPRTGDELWAFEDANNEAELWGPSFSPDGTLVAAASLTDDWVRVWDLTTGDIALDVDSLAGPFGAYFSPDGSRLAVPLRFEEPTAVVMDATTGEEAFTLQGHEWEVHNVAWSPDGRWLATASWDNTARIWDAGTGDVRFTLHGHTGFVVWADWNPDSTRLVTGSDDGTAKLWEVTESGTRELLTLSAQGTTGGVTVSFSPDGERVMTGDNALTAAKIWDVSLAGDSEWTNLPAIAHAVTAIAVTPDGRLVTSNDDGSVTIWDTPTGKEVLTTDGHGVPDDPAASRLPAVAVSPDGALIAAVWDGDPPVTVWDATTGDQVFTVESDEGVQDVTWNADGTLLAMAGERGVTILDRSWEVVAVLHDRNFAPLSVRFSPDGRHLATAREPTDRVDVMIHGVALWDWQRAQVMRTFEARAEAVAFDPGGMRLAIGHFAGTVEIRDVESGEHVASLAGHTGPVWGLTFSADGSRIASASRDATVKVWDAETGEVVTLHGHSGPVSHVAFSPDGAKLASAGPGLIRVWALDLDDLIGIAHNEVTRTLTDEECRRYLHAEQCPS